MKTIIEPFIFPINIMRVYFICLNLTVIDFWHLNLKWRVNELERVIVLTLLPLRRLESSVSEEE